ncbi:hypothetical protein ABEY24_10390 [Peribacillus frigoritolerans]|uniref:hypothetical protein n=1 Tax=Peribacillus frigoritolerans TaxID=450367 RepID=UPI003D2977AC
MSTHTKGRPHKVSDNELRKILLQYSSSYPGRITCLGLEKETGIKRHVWSRRMNIDINKINELLISNNDNNDKLPLPNIEQIVEQYFDNKKELIKALTHINDVVQSLYDQNLTFQKKNKNLENEIEQRKSQVKRLDLTIREYEEIITGSAYGVVRKEKKLKKNLVSIEKQNENAASSLDFQKMFPNIFK